MLDATAASLYRFDIEFIYQVILNNYIVSVILSIFLLIYTTFKNVVKINSP